MTAAAQATMQNQQWQPDRMERRRRAARSLIRQGIVGDADVRTYVDRFSIAKDLRKPMESTWRDVRDYLLPACGRYLDNDNTDPNNEDYRVCYSRILDSSPTKMAITAADGLHGGMTNQGEQWFNLYTGDYANYQEKASRAAKDWIQNAQEAERDILAQSNFYSEIYQIYLEALGFGNALMLVHSDPDTFVQYYTKTVGSYWWMQNSRKQVDTVFIRLVARASDIVMDYGKDNCPERVIEAFDSNPDRKFNLIQCVQPWNYFGRGRDGGEWRYEDVRFLEDSRDDDKILYRAGYRTKPFVTVRWSNSGDYVYARSCPGIDALPDIKQLQEMALDYNKAIKWRVDPAWVTVSHEVDGVVPGHVYKIDGNVRDNLITPLVAPQFDIPAVTQAAQELRDRISAALYNREILLVQSRGRQITATEVQQLIQEKNAVLGPIIARIGDSALIPVLDRTFELLTHEWMLLQDPPEEIQGLEIKPYFTGQLAQAQRQGGIIQQINQALQIAGAIAGLDQQAPIHFDWGAMLRSADAVDVFPAGTIRTQDEVDEIMQAQQQAAQQQQQMAALQQGAAIAKDASAATVAPDNLLGMLAGGEGGEAMQ